MSAIIRVSPEEMLAINNIDEQRNFSTNDVGNQVEF